MLYVRAPFSLVSWKRPARMICVTTIKLHCSNDSLIQGKSKMEETDGINIRKIKLVIIF